MKDIWVFLLALSPLFSLRAPSSGAPSGTLLMDGEFGEGGFALPLHIIHRRDGRCSGGRAMGSRQRSHNSNYNLFVMFLFFLSVWLFLSFFLAKTVGVGCTPPGLLCMCVLKLGGVGERGVRG